MMWCLGVCFVTCVSACSTPVAGPNVSLTLAERFISAFYSGDPEALEQLMLPGQSADNALYYQAWAEAAHYRVIRRQPCSETNAGKLRCAITVTDDFGTTLGYTATDTFVMTIENGVIETVSFTGDDPEIFQRVFAWLTQTQPEVFTGPCRNMFAGGTTPAACARAIAAGARAFMAEQPSVD